MEKVKYSSEVRKKTKLKAQTQTQNSNQDWFSSPKGCRNNNKQEIPSNFLPAKKRDLHMINIGGRSMWDLQIINIDLHTFHTDIKIATIWFAIAS